MRNPKRITPILATIREIWEQYPDMRLGQLLLNACPELENNPFYIEDDVVLDGLRKFAERCEFPLTHFLEVMEDK